MFPSANDWHHKWADNTNRNAVQLIASEHVLQANPYITVGPLTADPIEAPLLPLIACGEHSLQVPYMPVSLYLPRGLTCLAASAQGDPPEASVGN